MTELLQNIALNQPFLVGTSGAVIAFRGNENESANGGRDQACICD